MNAPSALSHLRPQDVSSFDQLAGWELIRKLVGFDTTSRDSNLALIDWAQDFLGRHGFESKLTFDDTGSKANLWATLPARDGNATDKGIVLSGHTDVVPVDGQPWDSNPFDVTVRGDRAFGRGVTDMKSFIATALAFVPTWRQRGLARPLHLALSYDEEIGCIGVHRLIADVVARGIRPAGCIVGEPTGMRLVVAHKGKKGWRCRVRGHEAHSSLTPHGVNAVQIGCEIVAYIAQRARGYRDAGRRDDAYDVPYTTVHVGTIRGGTALNIVPRDCSFEFEIRHLPFDDPDAFFAEVQAFAQRFLPEMHAVDRATHIEFDHLSTLPGMDTHPHSDIAGIARACNDEPGVGKVSFGTEASLFFAADIPTVICGPGHIAQAHQPNEYVELSQLARCEAFMARLTERLCAS
jgi:acetylornithine deacetylase